MTRKQALIELRDKVTSWDDYTILEDSFIENWAIATPDMMTLALRSDGESSVALAIKILHGSFDAALALHQAVLPKYSCGIIGPKSNGKWEAMVVPQIDNPPEFHHEADTASLALLLAILSALISECEE